MLSQINKKGRGLKRIILDNRSSNNKETESAENVPRQDFKNIHLKTLFSLSNLHQNTEELIYKVWNAFRKYSSEKIVYLGAKIDVKELRTEKDVV